MKKSFRKYCKVQENQAKREEKHNVQALTQKLQELMQQVPSIVIEEILIEESNAMG